MKNGDYKMEITEKGDDKLRELCEKSFEWLEPDNTIGDFFTVFFENVVNEMLSDEIKAIPLKDLEDPEKSENALKLIFDNENWDIFMKVKGLMA